MKYISIPLGDDELEYYTERNTLIDMLESGVVTPAQAIEGIYAAAPHLDPRRVAK